MRVERVTTRAALREFVGLPARLHPADLAVPLLASTIESWWRGTSPHPEPIELLLVRDDAGTVVGRSTVHTDARLDERLGTRSLLFGATELADEAAALALVAELDVRARAHGARQLFGPVSLLPNQAGGVITSGFDERGFVDSAWNPPRYPSMYEALGFERWGESDTWVVDVPAGADESARPTTEEWAAAGLTLEHGRRRDVGRLVPELLGLLNASFEQLPYYTQITPAEMAAATDGLSFLLDEKLLLLARDATSGEAVAFVLVVPDITTFLQSCGGRLGPLRQLQLLATRGRYREDAVLIIQGTAPDRQGRGILTLLSRELHANLAAGGYRRLRSTYVGRENLGSARQFARVGGRPLHGYTFYRRDVPTAAHPPAPPMRGTP
ncbi:hypothetical protein [Sanguibacter sp. 25GB23B1]|uniref:hypothetical protein n=1 Tax=unclassified Sanguibacter TaxID=2645534 RepID=UPI0032AF6257